MLPSARSGDDDRSRPIETPAAAGRARIVVVDDRRENQLAIEAVLRSPDHELVLLGSGAEALRYLLREDCALLLLDVQMPDLDGYETARLVRGNPRTRSIPIVFMAAVHREERFVAVGYEAGCIDYILKPVDPDVLRAKVAGFVQLHRSRQEELQRAALLRERERVERQVAIEQLERRALERQRAASFSVDVTEAQEAEEELAFLAHAGLELSGSLELEDTVRRAASLAVPFLAEACTVAVWLGDGEVRATSPESPAPPTEGAAEAPTTPFADGHPGAEHLLPVALRRRDHELGWMRFARRRPFSAREKRAVAAFAERASQAIENAVLYRKAQDAVRLRDEFISIASHELRSPLTALTLQVRLSQRAAAAEPGAAAGSLPGRITSMARQVERLNRLVANLLDVARLRVGRMELSPEPVDLTALVEEVAGRFQEDVARQGRQLVVSASGPLEGRWDRVKLEQVLTNLVSNAVRHGAAGPIHVTVGLAGDVAEVAVRDRGPGIRPEDQARIFERYERGEGAGGSGGLGLGLYLVRLLVEAHGGCVRLESKPGEGAAFTVALPLRPAAERVAEAGA